VPGARTSSPEDEANGPQQQKLPGPHAGHDQDQLQRWCRWATATKAGLSVVVALAAARPYSLHCSTICKNSFHAHFTASILVMFA
jgi:hypothetical protein